MRSEVDQVTRGYGVLGSIVDLVASYVVGLMVPWLLLTPFAGFSFFAFGSASLLIGLPFLGVAAIAAIVFRRSIRRRLGTWCIIAPLTVWCTWHLVEYSTVFAWRPFSALDYLEDRAVWERGALVLVSAYASSFFFYQLERLRT